MFEKESEEYANKYVTEGVDELKIKVIKGHWQDGAEFGYNKAKEEMQKRIEELEAALKKIAEVVPDCRYLQGTRLDIIGDICEEVLNEQ